jgi:hypothetical protein
MARRADPPAAYRAVFYRLLEECDDEATEWPVARMVILGAATPETARGLAVARFHAAWPQAALLGDISSIEIEMLPADDDAAPLALPHRRRLAAGPRPAAL